MCLYGTFETISMSALFAGILHFLRHISIYLLVGHTYVVHLVSLRINYCRVEFNIKKAYPADVEKGFRRARPRGIFNTD